MKTKEIKLTDKKLKALNNRIDNKLMDGVLSIIMARTESERIHFITDTLSHGCVSGIVGELIYYSDTVTFYQEYKEEIFEIAAQQAEDFGLKNALEVFAGLNGAQNVGSADQMENLFAWYGFEEMLRIIANELSIEI